MNLRFDKQMVAQRLRHVSHKEDVARDVGYWLSKLALMVAEPGNEFTLASGKKSRVYIDVSKATAVAEAQRAIAQHTAETISRCIRALLSIVNSVQAIGGPDLGARPLVHGAMPYLAADYPNMRSFAVLKSTKDHGIVEEIEGNLRPDDNVILIEDVITSGGSVLRAAEAVERTGANVVFILALLDRMQGGAEKISEAGYALIPLCTMQDLHVPLPVFMREIS